MVFKRGTPGSAYWQNLASTVISSVKWVSSFHVFCRPGADRAQHPANVQCMAKQGSHQEKHWGHYPCHIGYHVYAERFPAIAETQLYLLQLWKVLEVWGMRFGKMRFGNIGWMLSPSEPRKDGDLGMTYTWAYGPAWWAPGYRGFFLVLGKRIEVKGTFMHRTCIISYLEHSRGLEYHARVTQSPPLYLLTRPILVV